MRLHLTLALITVIALVITLRARDRHRFEFPQVQELAAQRAAQPYAPLPDILPPQLQKLTDDQERGIFWNEKFRLWRSKGLPFQSDFYFLNKRYRQAPHISTVDHRGVHSLAYSPSNFNFNFPIDPPLTTDLGFAGFYLRYPNMAPDGNPNRLDGFFSVLGTNYFRVLASKQVYGLSARGLAVNTGVDGKPEEFPVFTDWYLHEPTTGATQVTLDAILDSPSVTGAYEFHIRPGAVTSVDVHAFLYFRKNIDRLGVAPFSSMYLFGENAKDHFNDYHPEVHDSDGVLIEKNNKEWIWRPLQQLKQAQQYVFPDENPRGFGLLQRDRDFQHYQDLDKNYNVRPSAFVTPRGNWGKGSVQIVQLPSNNFNTDNVVMFWHRDDPIKSGDTLDVSYTIDFYMNDAARPPLAYCRGTQVNFPAPPSLPPAPPATPVPVAPPPSAVPAPGAKVHPATAPVVVVTPPAPVANPNAVQFQMDFVGNGIEDIPANGGVSSDITYPPGAKLQDVKVEKNGYDKSWHVTFTIIPEKPNVPVELLCRLSQNGKLLTETWSYTWHPPALPSK